VTAAAGAGRRIVVGVGNRDRGDDAIGPAVCDRVRALDDTVDVWVVESDVSSLAVRWRPHDTVVVVDAVVTGAAPGTMHVLDPDRLPVRRPTSSHELGVVEAIALATALGTRPRDVTLIGVEAASFEHGAPMTPEVADAVDRVARFVLGRPDGGAAPAAAGARRED
jgi:hydrogenase maturation protease